MAKIKIENGTLFNMMQDLIPNNQGLNLPPGWRDSGIVGQISFLTGEWTTKKFLLGSLEATLNNSIFRRRSVNWRGAE